MRTIRVTGAAQIAVKPDLLRITITLVGKYPEYSETLQRSAEDTERLRELLISLGFAGSDLKTLSFQTDTEYESYEENGVYKQRFVGYSFRHQMKLEFDADSARLGEVLYALANSKVKPEFRLSYTVKDAEAVKNALLGQAVRDAKQKAEVLAQAAEVRLGAIRSIVHSREEADFEVRPMNQMLAAAPMAAKRSYDLNIEPEDITANDTVTVIWEIV